MRNNFLAFHTDYMGNILGYLDSCTFLEMNKNIEYAIILFRTVGFIELFIYHIIENTYAK